MPARMVKTKRDERLWKQAKKIVEDEYVVRKGSDAYWALVNRIYSRMKYKVGGGEWPGVEELRPNPEYRLYEIVANATMIDRSGWRKVAQIPTFYLDKDIQGIVSEKHAERIAEKIINPFELDFIEVHATATEVE